jgi:MtfA peptidase
VPVFRFLKRKWLLRKSFPENWERMLINKVPVYRKLPNELQEKLKQRVVILLDEKHFEGCGGLTMSDEIRLVISAYASVLILEVTSDYYSGLQSILIYPDDYVAPVHHEDEGGIVSEGYESRQGEYWGAGSIVLSWNDIKRNLYTGSSGNLIYHEFSHLLDDRYGLTAGISDEGKPIRDDEWTHTFAKAYRKLIHHARTGKPTVLDPYGATNPAELFSVATEAFFEKPQNLKRELPGLYGMLKSFYQLDPLTWPGFK